MRYYILPVDAVGNGRGPKYFRDVLNLAKSQWGDRSIRGML
jgi:hypothetical protein